MKTIKAIAAGLAVLVLGALASTGYLAWYCGYVAYWPLKTHQWLLYCMERQPARQLHALLIFLAFALVAGLVSNFCCRDGKVQKEFGTARWATLKDMIGADLIMKPYQRSKLIRVLGKFADQFITYTGAAHVLVCGGNRSGKGRGIGIPTALSLACSIVFHDSKGEFMFGDPKHGFPGTSGLRAKLGHKIVYFNPKDRRSARYNPLLMVRRGDNEVADMQRLILTLMGRAPTDFWEKGGGRMMLAIGLHILYGEPNAEKSLAGMGRFLDRGDEGLEHIMAVKAHPLAARIAQGFFPGGAGGKDSDKVKGMRSGLYFTARDFLSFYDDPVAAEITSGLCQFEPADLAKNDVPTALYLVPPADDQTRAAPLMALIIGQILGELVSQPMDRTASGHPKKHDTVLLLDEFTALGRMDELISKLPQMPGYGVTAHLFIQSVSQLDEVYSPNIASTIIDNCGASVWFAAADPRTAQRIVSMIGNATEVEPTVSTSRPTGAWFGGVTTTGEREVYRSVLDTGAVRELPADTELVFVNGCKPVKAKKVQYDKEPVFRGRLLPAPPVGDGNGTYPGLTNIPSPWWVATPVQPQTTSTSPTTPALPSDDVPDFQPEWMTT
ncbi:type IV secretion system protein VirD4 [Skermanella aerolata]|uniref:type IV secretory system conjugative DNA transfer family protein n=1 Tax=Skermanella aerolata TaxID=393310 RepID=UPI003D231A0D